MPLLTLLLICMSINIGECEISAANGTLSIAFSADFGDSYDKSHALISFMHSGNVCYTRTVFEARGLMVMKF